MLQRLHAETRRPLARPTSAVLIALAAMAFVSGCEERDTPTAAEQSPQQLFLANCAACHGADGSGNGPVARELRVAPANLRLLKQNNDGTFPTRRVQQAIDSRGMPAAHGLPDMPVWGTVWKRQGLTEPQVRAQIISLTAYIGTLQD